MTPERWKTIEDIFQEALDCSPAEREIFVRKKTGDDEDLRREVEKLIARYETDENFLESPVWTDSLLLQSKLKEEIASSLEDLAPLPPEQSLVGRQIGAYRLTRELGRGGMGVVFLAERADGEFQQKVAVKLIKRGMDTDFILRRFRQERQIAATLNHPNIARLLDGGTTEDDLPYFVMEYIEGSPFFKYAQTQNLNLREKLELFLQVCAAIAYAHRKRIIHRDIKPSNILVTDDGEPKLLDFGIAKILDPDLIHESAMPTATQMRLMTPEYASPEQARGDEIDEASDQYSLGVLLYELLTGHRPYKFPSRAPHEIARIICEEMPSEPSSGEFGKRLLENAELSSFEQDFCQKLDRIVLKTLRKNPTERYSSVKEFAADIARFLKNETVLAESFSTDEGPAEPGENILLPTIPNQKSIAILPFKTLNTFSGEDTGDSNYLTIGLADALITRLSNVRQFVVRPTSSVMRFNGTDADSFSAGREMSVDFVLDGNILKTEKRIRVSVQLLNVAEGATVWAERFDEDLVDVFTLEDSISKRVIESLVPRLSSGEQRQLAKRSTEDATAYEAYLRGRFYWNTFTEESFAKAFVAYHEAITHDPNYALAYAGIADYYIWLGIYGVVAPQDCYPPARAAATRAIELDSELADAYASLGFADLCGSYDWQTSERNMLRAIELNPNYAVARLWYSYVLQTAGRFDEGIVQALRAVELDPLTYTNYHVLAWSYYFARRFDKAVKQAAENVRKFPGIGLAHFTQSWILRFLGRDEDALIASQRAIELSGNSLFVLLGHGQALAAAGKKAETEEVLQRLFNLGEKQYLSYYQVALIYVYGEEKEKALDAFEKAYEAQEGWLIWLRSEPALDFLRDEPRFQAVLEKINHPLAKAEVASPAHKAKRGSSSVSRIAASEAQTIIQEPVPEKKRSLPAALKYALAAIGLILIGFVFFNIYKNTTFDFSVKNLAPGESWSSNFASTMNIQRLTDSGQAQIGAVSPDGKYVVYVLKEDDRQGLLIRETTSSEVRQLVAPDTVLFASVRFSPDSQTVYYNAWAQNFIARNLYRIPVSGNGSPQLVLEQVNSGIGFSPDGKQIAYSSFDQKSRKSFLTLAEVGENGTIASTRTLAEYAQPGFIRSYPSFAPDGQKIAYVVGETIERKDSMSVYAFDLATNTPTKISERTFGDISGIAWRDNGGEIVVSAAERDGLPYQLWAIAYPSGAAARLTNDFSSYFDVSVARNSTALVTAKREKSSAIWLADLNSPDNAKQLTPGSDRLDGMNGVSWTADNQILYVGGIGSQYSIMMMNADGTNNRALDINVIRPTFPSMTKDKRHIVFADSKEQGSSVWRYDTQSGSVEHLTPSYAVSPTLSPDNRFVIYSANSTARKVSLHKIPIEGGNQAEITPNLSASAIASPDGKWIACYYSGEESGNSWRMTILSAENGTVRRVITPPDTFNIQIPLERALAWSPDGRSIYYVNDKNSVSNIFRIEVEEEKPPVQITRFPFGRIFDFSLSPDGTRMVIARGASSSDIVIFKKTS